MKGKHAQKNFGAVGTMAPTPPSLKTGGEGGGGGWECRMQGPGPATPPVRAASSAPQGAKTRVQVFADIQNFALRAHCVYGISYVVRKKMGCC